MVGIQTFSREEEVPTRVTMENRRWKQDLVVKGAVGFHAVTPEVAFIGLSFYSSCAS